MFRDRKGQHNSIVLITDGREECNGDPCAATTALVAAGFEVKVNVVGFKLSRADQEAVACISKISGGRYFDAQDANALKSALAQVRQSVTQALPPPPALPPLPPLVSPPPPPAARAADPPPPPNLIAKSQGGELIAVAHEPQPSGDRRAPRPGRHDHIAHR